MKNLDNGDIFTHYAFVLEALTSKYEYFKVRILFLISEVKNNSLFTGMQKTTEMAIPLLLHYLKHNQQMSPGTASKTVRHLSLVE